MSPTRASLLVALGSHACEGGEPRVAATTVDAVERLGDVVEIQAFDGAVCARDARSDVYCWGDQYKAAHLDGPEALGNSMIPRKIRGAEKIVRLGTRESAFGYATAVREDGEIVVWPHVELRPRIEFEVDPQEKVADGQWVRVLWGAEDRRVPDPDPWHARATGLKVEAVDLFADTGCFYSAGLLACPGVRDGIDLPRYDGLVWRYEPGIVDIAMFHDPQRQDEVQGACVQYDDGRVECRRNDARHVVEIPGKVKAMFGGTHVVVLLEDGRVGRIADGRTLVFDEGVAGMMAIAVTPLGMTCGVDVDGAARCWNPPWEETRRRTRIAGIDRAIAITVQERLGWCVLELTGHVKCAELNQLEGDCNLGSCDFEVQLSVVPAGEGAP